MLFLVVAQHASGALPVTDLFFGPTFPPVKIVPLKECSPTLHIELPTIERKRRRRRALRLSSLTNS